jgi:YkoY family integral membrane protein
MNLPGFLTPSMSDIAAAIPLVLLICIVDILMSMDNLVVLSTIVEHLPRPLQRLALSLGLPAAFVVRAITLACVAVVLAAPWLKGVFALYLVYLACVNLGSTADGAALKAASSARPNMIGTVFAVELAYLACSLDNVLTAAAMSSTLWVVCLGSFLSMILLRYVAGFFSLMLEKFPVLDKVAHALVGFIAVQLVVDFFLHVQLDNLGKLIGVVCIAGFGLAYERSKLMQRFLAGPFSAAQAVLANVALVMRMGFQALALSPALCLCCLLRKVWS